MLELNVFVVWLLTLNFDFGFRLIFEVGVDFDAHDGADFVVVFHVDMLVLFCASILNHQ